jgi:AcrR family transcriptional regulator
MKSAEVTSIRDRYKAETRERILDAAIEELSGNDLEGLRVAAVAARAGVTERTVFRHFPTRDALIAAVWPRMQARVRSPGFADTADGLIASPVRLFPAFDQEEGLVRASAFSSAGREVRRAADPQRRAAFRAAVKDAFPDLEEPELTRLAAITQLINSAYGWAVLREHWGLDGEAAGRAASDAIAVLLGRRPAGPPALPKERKTR